MQGKYYFIFFIFFYFHFSGVAQKKTILRKVPPKKTFQGSYATGRSNVETANKNTWGIYFSTGFNTLLVSELVDSLSVQSHSSTAFGAGFLLEYDLSNNWAIRFMPNFQQQTHSFDYKNFNLSEGSNQKSFSQNQFSLVLPILLVLKSKKRRGWRAYMNLGLSTEIAISQNKVKIDDLNLNFSNMNISAEYGAGLEKDLGNSTPLFERIGVELRFSNGLSNLLLIPPGQSLAFDRVSLNQLRINFYFIFH